MSHRASYQSSHQPKRLSKSGPLNRRCYHDEDEDEDEYEYEEDIDLGETDEDDDDEDYTGYRRAVEANYRNRNPKRQKVQQFNTTYEFRPRNVNSGRVLQPEWNDHSTHALLETWGERFLQLGRSSLRSDDWSEVAERVSELTGLNIGVSDCRSRLNVLKNKYKREKAKIESIGGGNSKWIYFKKMDVLMTLSPRQQQQCGLACGVDSGEFVFMNPRVYLDHSNALDEMRDSPGNSESEEGDEDEEDEEDEEENEIKDLESCRMLSDSIKRVGKIYEKIENSKRQHMMELVRMRMEFQRDLELQKKEMIERSRAEIARLREGEEEDEEEDGDCSADTGSE